MQIMWQMQIHFSDTPNSHLKQLNKQAANHFNWQVPLSVKRIIIKQFLAQHSRLL